MGLVAENQVATGLPLLASAAPLDMLDAPLLIPATGLVRPNSGEFSINQPSYEFTVTLDTALTASLEIVEVLLIWSIDGITVDQDDFLIPVPKGGSGDVHSVMARGPAKGNSVVIEFFSQTSQASIVSWNFYESSRLYTTDICRTFELNAASVFEFSGGISMNASSNLLRRILLAFSASVPLSSTETFALPIWTGKFSLWANTASDTTDMQIFATGMVSGGLLFNAKSDATGLIQLSGTMAREQYALSIRNANVAAKTINCYIVAEDY